MAVDSSIKDHPRGTCDRSLQVPVLDDVRRRVAVSQSVVSGHKAPLSTQVDSEEGEWLILGPTVGHASSNEGVDIAAVSKRAGEGSNLANRVWILPVSALAVGAKVVEHAVLVEVILEHELAWGVKENVLQAALRHLGVQSSAEAWLLEALSVWLPCQLVSIVVDALVEEMPSDRLAHVE